MYDRAFRAISSPPDSLLSYSAASLCVRTGSPAAAAVPRRHSLLISRALSLCCRFSLLLPFDIHSYPYTLTVTMAVVVEDDDDYDDDDGKNMDAEVSVATSLSVALLGFPPLAATDSLLPLYSEPSLLFFLLSYFLSRSLLLILTRISELLSPPHVISLAVGPFIYSPFLSFFPATQQSVGLKQQQQRQHQTWEGTGMRKESRGKFIPFSIRAFVRCLRQ